MAGLRRRPVVAVSGVLALSALVSPVAHALDWTDPVPVTAVRDARLSALHELAATPDALHLVHGRQGPDARDDRLVHQRSLDGGRTWTTERALFRSTAADRTLVPNIALAAREGLVAVAWRTRGPAGTTLWFRRSTDGGVRWQPALRLSTTDLQRGLGVPAVTISGSVVLAAWTDRTDGAIVLRRSTDGGVTWGEPRTLGSSRLSLDCAERLLDGLVGLVSAGRTIHLAWSDGAVGACISTALLVRTSTDVGRSWGRTRTASTTRSYGWPAMAARGKRLLMSVQQPDDGFLVVRSADTGATFTERRFAPTAEERSFGAADLTMPGRTTAWLTYADLVYRGGRVVASRIRYRASGDSGASWGVASDVLRDADRLRQATNLAAWASRPVIVFQAGRLDGSTSDILVTRAR